MAVINFSAATKQARATTLITRIGTGGTVRLYTGTIPASPDISPTGALLATLTLPLATAANAVTSFARIPQVIATATGTVGYVRISNAAGVAMLDLDVSRNGGAASVLINAGVTSGEPVLMASITITET